MGSTEDVTMAETIEQHLDQLAEQLPPGMSLTVVARGEGEPIVRSNDALPEVCRALQRIERRRRRQRERPPQRQASTTFDPRKA